MLKRNLYLYYLLLFIVIGGAIFLPYWLTDTTLIWSHDGLKQHLPALITWHETLRHLVFDHQWPNFWQAHQGFGQDYFQTYAYYVMGDIFTYPSLLFKESALATYYSVSVIIRLVLAGLSFIFVIRRLPITISNHGVLLGACVYTFSGYANFAAFRHPFFLNPLIIFPLLILAVHQATINKRYGGLILMTWWTLWNNFYFAFILGLGALIYWLYINHVHKTWRQQGLTILSVGIGALLSAPLLIPTITQFFQATRSASTFANGLLFYPISYYLTFGDQLINVSTAPQFWFNGGLLALSIVALVHYVTQLPHKWHLVLPTLLLLLPTGAAVFNGFSAPSNRWTMLAIFPVALLTGKMLDALSALQNRTLLVAGGIGVFGYLGLLLGNGFSLNNSSNLIYGLYFITILLLATRLSERQRRLIVSVISVISLLVLFNHTHANDLKATKSELISSANLQTITKQIHMLTALTDRSMRTLVSGNLLSNLNTDDASSNLPNALKLNSVGSYWSLQPVSTSNALRLVATQTSTPNDAINTLDNRNVLSNVLGIKTRIDTLGAPQPASYINKNGLNIANYTSYVSANSYPLFTLPKYQVSLANYRKLSATQREATLADSVVTSKPSKQRSAFAKQVSAVAVATDSTGKWQDKIHYRYATHASTLPDGFYIKLAKAQKQTELHLELTNIKYVPYSFRRQKQQALANYRFTQNQTLANPQSTVNNQFNPHAYTYTWLKQHAVNAFDQNTGYTMTTTYGTNENRVTQTSQSNLSFYQKRDHLTINLGTAQTIKLADLVALNFSQPGTYSFDISVQAIPVGASFDKVAQTAIATAPKSVQLKKDAITGNVTVKKSRILASSIPYNHGWHSKTNQLVEIDGGFLGIKLHRGTNQIKVTYTSPNVYLGLWSAVIGAIILVSFIFWQYKSQHKH